MQATENCRIILVHLIVIDKFFQGLNSPKARTSVRRQKTLFQLRKVHLCVRLPRADQVVNNARRKRRSIPDSAVNICRCRGCKIITSCTADIPAHEHAHGDIVQNLTPRLPSWELHDLADAERRRGS